MLRQAQYSHHDFFTSYAAQQIKNSTRQGEHIWSCRFQPAAVTASHFSAMRTIYKSDSTQNIHIKLEKKDIFCAFTSRYSKNKNCTFRINATISHPQHMYYEDALLHHYSTTTPSQREYPEEIFSCFSIKNWTTRCNYRFLCRTLASVYCILYCRSMTMLYTFREPQSLLLHTSHW